jgi:glycosyltransferase involved in cell wall biosynthesis
MHQPRVLMVTGVYHPETSGASLQCRELVRALSHAARFQVLTTSAHRTLPSWDVVDGVHVRRVYVDPSQPSTKAVALLAMTAAFARAAREADVVHFHGFSQKNMLLTPLARLMGKRTVMKLTSVGHDDALTMKGSGGLRYRTYRGVDHAIAVSPRLQQTWVEAGLDPARVTMIPNSVDTTRFRPGSPAERDELRAALGWEAQLPVVLFVGFFSHEKRPDALYRAWKALWNEGVRSTLALVGATQSKYVEIDSRMAEDIRRDAAGNALARHVHFIERTDTVEHCYRAADVFALPTTREGLPNVLLESMASGVPPVITRLPGVTDWIVENNVSGRLVPPSDDSALVEALRPLLTSPALRQRMGAAARAHVERHFTSAATALRTLELYQALLHHARSRSRDTMRPANAVETGGLIERPHTEPRD